MDIAKCILDNKTYTALEFSKLPPGELSTKRKYLVCKECQATAFFRKASRKGHTACFGAFPHLDGCSHSLSGTQSPIEATTNKDVMHYSNDLIELDLRSTFATDIGSWPALNKKTNNSKEIICSAEDIKSGTFLRRQLSDTLIDLIRSEKLGASTQKLNPKNGALATPSDFFLSFDKVESYQSEELHGYWGMLTDARLSGEGALWLNSGGRGDISCVIPIEMVDTFFKRHSLEDEEDLAGAYAIVLGILKVSKTGKKYIRLSNVDHIDLISIRPDENITDKFFITKKTRTAFLLTHNQLGVFDDELGIKRKHYIDKNAAREWRARLASQFHPDKNQGDLSMNYDEILSCINKIYNRMIGEA